MRLTVDLGPKAARVVAEAASSPFLARRIENTLDRYELILQRTVLPPFTDTEWDLLLEAHAGTISEPATVIEDLPANVADAMMGRNFRAEGGVDAAALLARLRALDTAQLVALVERLERRREAVHPDL